jgi:CubicO group peptidase (beta-lactamase class C family)
LQLRIGIIVCFCVATFAQEHKLDDARRAQLESTVAKFMTESSAPGISVALVEDGEYVWSEGFGMADLENFVPATPHTLYRLASISKSLTATGAMQLWERGKLDLDAPVQKYCPAFPQKSSPITTREVMGHLGGIRHYKSESQDDPEIGNTRHFDNPITGGLEFFKNDPLVATPGTKFSYSTQGYTLVGCAMEGASAQIYVDYMRENVFLPSGMNDTQVDDRFAIIPRRTRFYHKDDSGHVVNAEFLDSSYKIPGGGWLSSADDMARFEVSILHEKLLKPATRDVMWTAQKLSNGTKSEYALGWGTGTKLGVFNVGHAGGQQGTSTYFMIVPERKVGIVVLANMDDVDSSALAFELMKIVLAKQ